MIQEVNKDNFEEEVLKAEKPVMVDFWGPTCAQCKALMPIVEKIAEDFADKLKVVKMNIVGNRIIFVQQQIMGLPTFIFYKNGQEVKRLAGQVTKQDIEKAVGEVI